MMRLCADFSSVVGKVAENLTQVKVQPLPLKIAQAGDLGFAF